MTRNSIALLIVIFYSVSISAQELVIKNPYKKDEVQEEVTKYASDEEAVRQAVYGFFSGMFKADTGIISSVLLNYDISMVRTSYDNEGNPSVGKGDMRQFLSGLSNQTPGRFREEVSNMIVQVRDNLASVWMDFHFYLDNKISHCGVNNFELAKTSRGWKISHIADTRQNEPCVDAEMEVHQLLDGWHQAAASSDLQGYFDAYAPQGIFLGTDVTERWDKQTFLKYAEPAFKQSRGWKFNASNRVVYFDDDRELAWFEEELDTWMGPCRGSGVVKRVDGVWKIFHYNLAVLVPNEKIQDYIQLLNGN